SVHALVLVTRNTCRRRSRNHGRSTRTREHGRANRRTARRSRRTDLAPLEGPAPRRTRVRMILGDRSWAFSCRAPGGLVSAGPRRAKLAARGDVELGEHLAQVVGDGVLADEEPRADRGVREAVARESRDLGL